MQITDWIFSPGGVGSLWVPPTVHVGLIDGSIDAFSPHQVSTALQSSGGVLYTAAPDALHCTCWCAWMQLPWKPIPWSSLWTVLELIWRPREVWRSVAIDSAESWRPLRLSIRWPRSVILRGRPLPGWAAVVPNRFHFVMTPLTADCGIFSSEEMSQLDLLHRWLPITELLGATHSFTDVCRSSQ